MTKYLVELTGEQIYDVIECVNSAIKDLSNQHHAVHPVVKYGFNRKIEELENLSKALRQTYENKGAYQKSISEL